MEAVLEETGSMYAYSYGLAAGLEAKLLSGKDFESLAASAGPSDAVSSLESTPYGPVFRDLGSGYSIGMVHEALENYFRESYGEVASTLPAAQRRMLDLAFLGFVDVENVKVAARAVRSGLGAAAADKVISYGFVGEEELSRLFGAEDVGSFPAFLDQPYADIVKDALGAGDVQGFEESLDRGYVGFLLENTTKQVRHYTLLLADALNIRVLTRCKALGLPSEEHTLPGGLHVTDEKIAEMSRQDMKGIIDALKDTPYGLAARESLSAAEPDITGLTLGLEKAVDDQLSHAASREPLSPYSAIKYLRLKKAEMEDVRAAVTAKWLGLNEADTMRLIQ